MSDAFWTQAMVVVGILLHLATAVIERQRAQRIALAAGEAAKKTEAVKTTLQTAVKSVEQIKVSLQENTDTTETIHKLVNSGSVVTENRLAQALRRVATLTGFPADVEAADEQERLARTRQQKQEQAE